MLESSSVEKRGAFQDATLHLHWGSGELTFLHPAHYLWILHTSLFKNICTPL